MKQAEAEVLIFGNNSSSQRGKNERKKKIEKVVREISQH